MHETRGRFLRRALRAADLGVMTVAFGLAFMISGRYTHPGSLSEFFAVRVKLVNFLFFAAFAVLWYLLFRTFGLYRPRRPALVASEWWNLIKAVAAGTLLLSALGLVLDLSAVNRVFLASFFTACLLGTVVARSCLRSLLADPRRNGRNLRHLVIVGCGPRGAELGKQVRKKLETGYLLLGYIDDIPPPDNPLHGGPERLLGPTSRAREILSTLEVDEVVISLPIKSYYETISHLISLCEEMGLIVRIPADFFESRMVHAYADELNDTPVLTLRTHAPPAGSAALKRVIDLVVSSIALIVLSPLLVLIALAIKIDSRGPVFFLQQRVGLSRSKFTMVKFRTMRDGAETLQKTLEHRNEASGAAFKISTDPRVTRVGRLLRRRSLDELPQLWNVLRGEMSLVGPRPLPIRDVERFDSEWQTRRFSVKPGLTCLWQVNGRHKVGFEHWMELDLKYIDNWSLSLDFDILVKTLPAVLRGTGAS